MKYILCAIFSVSIFAYADDHSHLPVGGRRSLHGMVLVGAGPYFLEHIPMLTPPHDFQIVAEVVLKDSQGKLIKTDFSKGTFTLKPSSHFSLNDYLAGRLKQFDGAIFDGGFEQGGTVILGLDNVSVVVVQMKLARQLPAASETAEFEFTDGINVFQSTVITPAKNQQIIKNKTTGKVLWCVQGPDFFDPCQ